MEKTGKEIIDGTFATNVKEEVQNLQVDKTVIENLSKNLIKQHNSLVELLDTRLQQLSFFYNNLKEYKLNEIISYAELDFIIKKAHGLSINIEDVKTRLDKINYSKLFEKYDTYIAALTDNKDDIDLDILGAEIHDEMQSFFKDTSEIGSIIDVLVETYTVEVQVKLDSILRRIKNENDRLEFLTQDVKDIINYEEIKDTVVAMAEEHVENTIEGN